MSEKLFSPHEIPSDSTLTNSSEMLMLPPGWSILGGRYQDPDPNVVNYINQKYKEPLINLQESIMKSFELAGLVKSVPELLAQLEEQSPELAGDVALQNDKRRTRTFSADELDRNLVQQKVVNTINQRLSFSKSDENLLVDFAKKQLLGREMPPAYRILRVLTGIYGPEDINNTQVDEHSQRVDAPDLTRELAPDVYLLIMRDELEARQKMEVSAA